MKVHFHLHYATRPGETLHVLLYREGALANENKINVPLTCTENDFWSGEIQLLLDRPFRMSYHYEVRSGGELHRRENQQVPRVLALDPSVNNYFLHDFWRETTGAAQGGEPLELVAAQLSLFQDKKLPVFQRTIVLQTCSACPSEKESLWVCGQGDGLGNWSPAQAKQMQQIAPNGWAVALDADTLSLPAEYKFLVRPVEGNDGPTLWEEGPNHTLAEVSLQENETVIYSDFRPIFVKK